MNGNVHYTGGTSGHAEYYESAQGLNGSVRSVIWSGGRSTAKRSVIGADFGIVWRATPTVSIADQATYSSVHEPSNSIIPPQAHAVNSQYCGQPDHH